MSYPTFFPFRTHFITEGGSSTGSETINAVVPVRSVFVNAYWVPNGSVLASSGSIDITVNGTTAGTAGGNTGYTNISISSSTNGGPGMFATNVGLAATSVGVQYLNAGDILSTVISSSVGGTVTYVVREF